MKTKRPVPSRDADRRRRVRPAAQGGPRRVAEAPPRKRRPAAEPRPARTAAGTGPIRQPGTRPARPKNASQAKARSKARKAKAPKVVRPPLRVRLRERLVARLAAIELNPRVLISRVPFVVLVIGALGIGLAVTLWLSTGSAERSYQLGHARQVNEGLLQQKEALERDVLEAQAAPALAESARELGMIPSRDTAHLVQDATGNWTVIGTPKPAEGVPPPPLNTPLPEPVPPPPPAPRVIEPRELTVRMPTADAPVAPGIALPLPDMSHGAPGVPPAAPGPAPAAPLPGPGPVPAAPLVAPAPAPTGLPIAGVPIAPGPVAPAPDPATAQVPPAPAIGPEQFSPPVDPHQVPGIPPAVAEPAA